MKILYVTGREILYPRNEVILRAFQRFSEVTVVGYQTRGSLAFRSIWLSIRALSKLWSEHFDLVFVGFYGHLIMLPLGVFSRSPILFDAFISTYDTLVSDRQQFDPKSFAAALTAWLDRTACHIADWVLVDTVQQAEYFQDNILEPSKPISSIPVGCNDEIFNPREILDKQGFTVLFYCTFLPLHGVDVVIRAANILKDEPIHFKIIGHGPESRKAHQIAQDFHLDHLTWVDQVPLQKLPDEICAADVCLGGHFGFSEKAGRVIPGKIYQMLAVGCPVIAADTPANRQWLTHQVNTYLCPPGNPEALASAILELYHNPSERQRIGQQGRALYEKDSSELVITQAIRDICDKVIGGTL